MLTNFDRTKQLDYIGRLLEKTAVNSPLFGNIIVCLNDNEKFAIKDYYLGHKGEGYSAKIKVQHKKQALEKIDRRRARLDKSGKSHIGRCIQFCANYYRLSKHEQAIFELIARISYNKNLESLFDEFTEQSPFQRSEIIGIATKTPLAKVIEAMKPDSRLFKSFLVWRDSLLYDHFGYKLPEQLLLAFYNPLKDMGDLRRQILGNPVGSNLTWDDFSFMGPERELAEGMLKEAVCRNIKGVNILLYGPPGTGKTELCRTLADKMDAKLYPVADEKFDGSMADSDYRVDDLLIKQKWIGKNERALLLFDEMEDIRFGQIQYLGNNSKSTSKSFFNRLLEENTHPVLWTCNNVWYFDEAFIRRMSLAIELKSPPRKYMKKMLVKAAAKSSLALDDRRIDEISGYESISPAVFTSALKAAELAGGNAEQVSIGVKSLIRAMNAGGPVKQKGGGPSHEFRHEIANTDINLQNLTNSISAPKNKAFSFCFYGPPGTGKSAYARELARTLDMEVVFKRASDLLSMWVGGTEKNIAEAFEEALQSDAFLIIDEADSFLQDRSGANQSWEVTQVNEMLTWLESHPLPVALTTNNFESLDSASLRRFTFKVKFDYMNQEQNNKAFAFFFGLPAPRALKYLETLTPGDFSNVRKRAKIMGFEHNPEIVCKMLTEECELKPGHKNPIGFGV